MEQEMLSMISCAKQNLEEESSDSNCSIYTSHLNAANKLSKMERYKGVVPQQNGHWGSQIYANRHRIWLGTFKSEMDAAMAYDSAAIKLRRGDYHRNFPSNNISLLEAKFQSHFSTDVVLNMIRDGSYPSKFADFLRSQQCEIEIGLNLSSINGDGKFYCTLLFHKELTPSDVGKLNRLVIPKRYAVKHFSNVPDPPSDHSLDAERIGQVQLEFYDRQMNLWKFRYCYWKSSQSFVFTRGWNRFVKEKRLRANDTISFYRYETRDGRRLGQSFLVIDIDRKDDSKNDNEKEINTNSDVEKEEKLELGNHKAFVELLGSVPCNEDTKGFRLFGVQID